jgi:succinate dehydrogenase/fumarate reductase flavoprotein subunit
MQDVYDVIVVGGGGAGLACAVSAAEHGASVVLLEKCAQLGGSTGRAVGSFTASATTFQHRAGIADNPDDHQVDAGLFGPRAYEARNNAALRRYFFGRSAETLDWLTSMGLAFHGPSPEPPNRVARMHNVVPNAKAYVAVLQARFLRLGGTVVCDALVEGLVRTGDRVSGVTARVAGAPRTLAARRGVVLAAGDYTNSTAMISRYRGPEFAAIEGINPDALGDGHRLAEQAGARLLNMDITYGPELRFVPSPGRGIEQLLPSRGPLLRVMGALMPFVPAAVIRWMIKRLLVTWQHPEDAILTDGAILLNREGHRFCDERRSPEREIAVAAQPDKVAYLLMDERLATRYGGWPHYVSTAPEIAYAYTGDYLRLRPEVAVQGATVAGVAGARGLPPDAVLQAIDAYNADLAEAAGTDAGPRDGDRRAPLGGSRWILLGPMKAYFTNTEGGVAIDESLRVLDGDGAPIRGLYAAGQTGLGGMVLWGHGLHIAWALTSGRLAGLELGRSSADAPPTSVPSAPIVG